MRGSYQAGKVHTKPDDLRGSGGIVEPRFARPYWARLALITNDALEPTIVAVIEI